MRNQRTLQTAQSGFTLIELVMVIVILGILAATALPKFVDLATDARASAMQGVKASMQAANTMLYAKAAATNKLNGTNGTPAVVVVNGQNINTVFGYAQNTTELLKLMDLSTEFTHNAAGLPNGTFEHANAATPANCAISYTQAANATTAPSYGSPANCS